MTCAWQGFLKILPRWMREEVDRLGKDTLLDLRLRIGLPVKLILQTGPAELNRVTGMDDLLFVVNTASQYSPWAATTVSKGYLTAPGGHRIGICGDVILDNGRVTGVRTIYSLCIRIARDFYGIASGAENVKGSILIIGPPGSGKTTLLRDLIRLRSRIGKGSIGVVDERGEIFPCIQGRCCYETGINTDILSGCEKSSGIDMLLRTMGPACIAVDEITQKDDCDALLNAGWCGVDLLATAHASNKDDLFQRPVYRPIISNRLFQTVLTMMPNKTWYAERM